MKEFFFSLFLLYRITNTTHSVHSAFFHLAFFHILFFWRKIDLKLVKISFILFPLYVLCGCLSFSMKFIVFAISPQNSFEFFSLLFVPIVGVYVVSLVSSSIYNYNGVCAYTYHGSGNGFRCYIHTFLFLFTNTFIWPNIEYTCGLQALISIQFVQFSRFMCRKTKEKIKYFDSI